MKFISINQLKSKQETPQKILDKAIKINTKDIMNSSKEITILLEDLERLREGLLIKDEEIKRDLLKKPYTKITEEFELFRKQFKNVQFCDTASIKNILEKHAKIEEMRLQYKITNVLIEMENDPESDVLEKMIYDKDDWKLLARILHGIKKLDLDHEIKSRVKTTRKRFEEKLLHDFENAFDKKEKALIRRCYESFHIIDKGELIIKSFLDLLPLHSNENMNIGSNFATFEIESFNEDELPFIRYLSKVKDIYDNEINELIYSFFDYEIVIEKITKFLFEVNIAEKLGETLNVDDPTVFLVLFDICQLKIKELVCSIKISFNTCEFDVALSDLLASYFSICVFKEKESIDMFFEILTRKKKIKTEFKMRNESIVTSEKDPIKIIGKLINIFYLSNNRSKNMNYEDDEINELTHHFMKKLNEYVTMICANYMSSDRVELIKVLSDIYLLIKRYFDNSLFFDDFKELIDTRIELIFQNKIEESEARIKHIINKITLKDIESGSNPQMRTLIEFIKRESKVAHLNFRGQNEITYISKLMLFTYHRLYKKYLSFVYDQNSAKSLKSDIRIIYKIVKELELSSLNDIYDYLYEITEVIHVRKEDLKIYLKAMYHKIPETEFKSILKCRADYDSIKHEIDF